MCARAAAAQFGVAQPPYEPDLRVRCGRAGSSGRLGGSAKLDGSRLNGNSFTKSGKSSIPPGAEGIELLGVRTLTEALERLFEQGGAATRPLEPPLAPRE